MGDATDNPRHKASRSFDFVAADRNATDKVQIRCAQKFGPEMRGNREWPAQQQRQGTRKSEQWDKCKRTRLTICNRKPPILLLHLKLAMMPLRVVLFLVHVLWFFTRLHLGVEFWFLRRRGRRHDYEWFEYVQRILGLGVNACVSLCCQTTSDLNARVDPRCRQRRVGCAEAGQG